MTKATAFLDALGESARHNLFVHCVMTLIALAVAILGILAALPVGAAIPEAARGYQRAYLRIAEGTWGLNAPTASLAAQIHQESGWDCQAVSRVGARGCAQFMPATAQWIAGFSPALAKGLVNDPAWAFEAQVRYVRWLFNRVAGVNECEQLAFALSAYNGGEKRVRDRKALSRDPGRCFDATCSINPGIAAANQRENEDYPVRILKRLDGQYAKAGWGRELCVG